MLRPLSKDVHSVGPEELSILSFSVFLLGVLIKSINSLFLKWTRFSKTMHLSIWKINDQTYFIFCFDICKFGREQKISCFRESTTTSLLDVVCLSDHKSFTNFLQQLYLWEFFHSYRDVTNIGKGFTFWPMLGTSGHGVVRFLSMPNQCDTVQYCSTPKTRVKHTSCPSFIRGSVSTCFNKLCMSRLEIENPHAKRTF